MKVPQQQVSVVSDHIHRYWKLQFNLLLGNQEKCCVNLQNVQFIILKVAVIFSSMMPLTGNVKQLARHIRATCFTPVMRFMSKIQMI